MHRAEWRNNERKVSQDKSKGKGRGQKRKDRGPPSKASNVILKLGHPSISERTTSLKLEGALGNEAKEKLNNWRRRRRWTHTHSDVSQVDQNLQQLLTLQRRRTMTSSRPSHQPSPYMKVPKEIQCVGPRYNQLDNVRSKQAQKTPSETP